MRYPPHFLDEIRARLSVSQVVGRKVPLKRAGREFKGLSPFKDERTPSFTVNDQKGFYHCFASGEHGDIFTFLMKTEGLSFPEAVERLAGEAGVPMPKISAREEAREDERERLYRLMETACAFFEAALFSGPGAAGAPLPGEARAGARDDPLLPHRLRARRQVGAETASRQGGLHDRGDDRVGHADRRRGHSRRLRPLPPPRHVSHHRPEGPRHRLRRARARSRPAGEIPELAGDAALSQGPRAVQRVTARAGPRTTRPASSRSKATWT